MEERNAGFILYTLLKSATSIHNLPHVSIERVLERKEKIEKLRRERRQRWERNRVAQNIRKLPINSNEIWSFTLPLFLNIFFLNE